jgi:hypothetical protein
VLKDCLGFLSGGALDRVRLPPGLGQEPSGLRLCLAPSLIGLIGDLPHPFVQKLVEAGHREPAAYAVEVLVHIVRVVTEKPTPEANAANVVDPVRWRNYGHLRASRIDPVRALELFHRKLSLALGGLQTLVRLRPPGRSLDPRLTRLPTPALQQGNGAGRQEHHDQDQDDQQDGAHCPLLVLNRSMVSRGGRPRSSRAFTPPRRG